MIRFLKKIGKNNFFVCFGITFVTYLFVMSRYSVFFELDDIGMRNILSGITTKSPDAHVFFLRFPLAWMFTKLYTWFPGVYWYFLFFCFANYGCLFLLLYRIGKKAKGHGRLAFFLAALTVFLLLWMRQLILLEWTTTAGILSATAIFWYGTIPEHRSWKYACLEYAVSLLLFLLSYNLRFTVFFMLLPFAGIVILEKWIKHCRQWDRCKRISECMFCIVCILSILVCSLLHRVQYSSEKWQERKEFSQYRAVMFDYYGWPEYEKNEALYQECGISEPMYECLKEDGNFMLAATGVLSAENLMPIAKTAEEWNSKRKPVIERIAESLKSRWQKIWREDYGLYSAIYFTGMVLWFLSAYRNRERGQLILILLTLLGNEIIWFYLHFNGRLPTRVGYGLCMGNVMTVAAVLWENNGCKKIGRLSFVKLFLAFYLAVWAGGCFSEIEKENSEQTVDSQMKHEIKLYCSQHEDYLYIRDLYSFMGPKERIQDRDERLGVNYCPYNDWTCGMPLEFQSMPLDGSEELCSWISGRENVCLLVDQQRAQEVCGRQERLFASRGIRCTLRLKDQVYVSNGAVMQIYAYDCTK